MAALAPAARVEHLESSFREAAKAVCCLQQRMGDLKNRSTAANLAHVNAKPRVPVPPALSGATEHAKHAKHAHVALIPANAPLASASPSASSPHLLRILSHNIMIPNSKDGWWIYKCYLPTTPMELRQWGARKAMLKEALLSASADVVCVQEAGVEIPRSNRESAREH